MKPMAKVALFALAVVSGTVQARAEDLIEALQRNGFKTFSDAIMRAGAVDTLQAPGPITLFAPTERAFQAMTANQRKSLFRNKTGLSAFVRRHAVPGDIPQGPETATVKAMSGQALTLGRDKDHLVVDGVAVTAPLIAASNGSIYPIDAILPPGTTPPVP